MRVRFSFPSLSLKVPLLLLNKIRGIIFWCIMWGARVALFEILVSVLKKLNDPNDQVLKIPVSARWFPVLCFQKNRKIKFKITFNDNSQYTFWHKAQEFTELNDIVLKSLFSSFLTYLCKEGFSVLLSIKNTYKNRIALCYSSNK